MLGGGGLGGGAAFGFDTPENPPMALRPMHASGGSGGGRLHLGGAMAPPPGVGARDSRRAALGFNAREWGGGREKRGVCTAKRAPGVMRDARGLRCVSLPWAATTACCLPFVQPIAWARWLRSEQPAL